MPRSDVVRVLEVDPDLAEPLAASEREAATAALLARREALPAGTWEALAAYRDDPPSVGLLVIDGLLTRQVTVAERLSTELLGSGDLMRPWDQDGHLGLVPLEVCWQVIVPTTVAVLDRRFLETAGRWPGVIEQLLCRALRRSRWLGFLAGLRQITRIEGRLLVLLWAVSERWGRVTPRGIQIDLKMTHEQLGRLIGARRPSVTTALGLLSAAGFVERVPGGFLLHGDAADAVRHAAREQQEA